LVNGDSIAQEEAVGEVTYFHLEFDVHTVIYAEDAPAESFIDDESRGMFDNAAEYAHLYPSSRHDRPSSTAPRIEEGWDLEALRRRLQASWWAAHLGESVPSSHVSHAYDVGRCYARTTPQSQGRRQQRTQ
jgi:hypothetical protein